MMTGILPITANENGLAVVLGHEIAHQVARHSAERMSSVKVLFALSYLIESLIGIDVNFASQILNLLLTLPNSRTNETEADQIGLELAIKACYDPREAEKLWARMQEAEKSSGQRGSEFLSTHPASGTRIENVRKWALEVSFLISTPVFESPGLKLLSFRTR